MSRWPRGDKASSSWVHRELERIIKREMKKETRVFRRVRRNEAIIAVFVSILTLLAVGLMLWFTIQGRNLKLPYANQIAADQTAQIEAAVEAWAKKSLHPRGYSDFGPVYVLDGEYHCVINIYSGSFHLDANTRIELQVSADYKTVKALRIF